MLSKINSCAIHGIDAYIVEVETHMEGRVPYFTIVGLPDNAVKESRERVISAIKNSGYRFLHNKRITINLAPADVKKEGSAYDLPIAIGILTAQGEVSEEKLVDHILLGELALEVSSLYAQIRVETYLGNSGDTCRATSGHVVARRPS